MLVVGVRDFPPIEMCTMGGAASVVAVSTKSREGWASPQGARAGRYQPLVRVDLCAQAVTKDFLIPWEEPRRQRLARPRTVEPHSSKSAASEAPG